MQQHDFLAILVQCGKVLEFYAPDQQGARDDVPPDLTNVTSNTGSCNMNTCKLTNLFRLEVEWCWHTHNPPLPFLARAT